MVFETMCCVFFSLFVAFKVTHWGRYSPEKQRGAMTYAGGIYMQITIREPGSAITHFIGMMLALFAAVPLLIKAGLSSGPKSLAAMAIFMISMILLYGASATYHSVNLTGKALRVFRKVDHMMIFVLIAGSYTPVCLIVL